MELKDKKITCKDCGAVFDFTVNEQKFYAEHGLNNEPQRCKDCRIKKKAVRNQFEKPNNYSNYKGA